MKSLPIARFDNLAEARRVLLGRRSLEDTPLPSSVGERIREVFGEDLTPTQVVERILADVRREGDDAIRRYTRKIDGRDVASLKVPEEAIDAAVAKVPPPVYAALEAAAERVRAFHERAKRNSWLDFQGDGATGQIIRPLARVGIYAPGGRVPYPSSVLMAAIPARVAGVREVDLASPPGPDGEVAPALLAAARIAGVDAVYRMGGAQAIAGLAFGTESVSRVDKILGPGNVFVALAKRMVFGQVDIEGLAGPTECVLIADDTADARYLAADLIAQAEHDPLAQPILLCTSNEQIDRTLAEAAKMLETAPRADIIRESVAARTPGRSSRWSRTPAASSWATCRPRASATTPPVRATSCRPAGPRASARRSIWTTSSRSRPCSRSVPRICDASVRPPSRSPTPKDFTLTPRRSR
jgi:histidinol dehydrogenase